MIMCFVVLAFWPLTNEDCSELLTYEYYFYGEGNYQPFMHAVVQFEDGTTTSVKLSLLDWTYLGYGPGIFSTTIICVLGWVSDLLFYITKI